MGKRGYIFVEYEREKLGCDADVSMDDLWGHIQELVAAKIVRSYDGGFEILRPLGRSAFVGKSAARASRHITAPGLIIK